MIPVGPLNDSASVTAAGRGETFKSAAAKMLAAFVLADGHADERELSMVEKACGDLAVPADLFEHWLSQAAADPVDAFLTALIAVEDTDERELLAAVLFELASADAVFHEREAEFLDLMHDAWGVAVHFVNRPIRWDAQQREVIEAGASEKLIVSAGPGMGKTAVACARVAHLVEEGGCQDSNIWLVSFTRTAVAELKARIADFAEDPGNVFAAKISTIDSQAWKVRYGFTETQAEKLFGGFDTSIESALKLMKEREEDFRDAFSGLEHVIIDEAQDITGARADFLLHLLSLLPEECGATVFHDPAQAIYDYAIEGSGTRFIDEVGKAPGWRPCSLKKIYRTEDPALLRLYEELRLDILGNTDAGPSSFEARTDIVKRAASKVDEGRFDHKKLPNVANALVLFRKRVEVLQAAAFMAGDRVPHRLRISGLPRTIQPWIGGAFSGWDKRTVDRAEFSTLLSKAIEAGAPVEDDRDAFIDMQWQTMTRYGFVKGSELDLWGLRDRLHTNPPEEFTLAELGASGPILGTVHASKGREADHVVLQINRHWCAGDDDRNDHEEEARVLFVGATRAKRTLEVQGGLALPFASATDNGRCFRRGSRYKNGVQVQIGLAGDYDAYSILQTQNRFEFLDLLRSDTPFGCNAALENGTWRFRIGDELGRDLGWFSPALNGAFFEICKKVNGVGRKPPDRIKHMFVLGWTTAVAPTAEAQRLATIGTKAARSGFWIAPQIVGFPTTFPRW